MLNKAMFSSASVEWSTPQHVFDGLNAEFGFELDVCATKENAKCRRYFDKEDDGLQQQWHGIVWMNPPYGRGKIDKWMAKAFEASLGGATVVCLVPARTDTSWWHKYAMRGEIRLYKGRLKFGGSSNSAPFGSAVVIFRPPINRGELEVQAADERAEDELLTIKKARKLFPGRPSLSTIFRWIKKGTRGAKLESVRVGGRYFVSADAIERFIAAQQRAPTKSRKKRRSQSIEDAKRVLDALDI